MTKLLFILIAFIGGTFSIFLNIVQARSASNPTPENLSDVYDAETYTKWKQYCAEHSRLSIISSVITGIVMLALLFTDAYAAFASLFPDTPLMQILSIILLETVLSTLSGVVESYISNMVIEQKYGFNRTSIKTFIGDRIRSLLLGFVLSFLLAYAVWGFYSLVGVWMIPIFAGAMLVFSLVISFLYPIFSRIGNKFTPLEEGDLRASLMNLLTKHGYSVKAIEVMDASRRTTKLNAYFTGFGKMKTIVLFDNLVNAMTPDEICAVFAHELGHGLYKDVTKRQILNFFNMLIMGTAAWVAVNFVEFHTAFGFEDVNYGFSYILMGICLGVITPLTGIVMNAYSRFAEYRADRQSVSEGYGPAMITALKKLARENFSHLAPSKINVVLEYSHPPLSERIAAVEKEIKKSK
ncbi:MAG: M48 family metallopeptidase [Clostridia bacterium]|nr:M48 family metallopeptidase [Clostridia bacterium]